MLLAVGPFVDKLLAKQWILDYEFSVPAMTCLGWSCGVAVLVNISQFMCLGRFSAVTFQVGVGADRRAPRPAVGRRSSLTQGEQSGTAGAMACAGRVDGGWGWASHKRGVHSRWVCCVAAWSCAVAAPIHSSRFMYRGRLAL